MRIAGFFLFCPHPNLNPFTAIPFFRILLPYVSGIYCAYYFKADLPLWLPFVFLLLIICAIPFRSSKSRRRALLLADLLLFSLAVVNLKVCRQPPYQTLFTELVPPDSSVLLLARINEVPVSKAKSRKCELKILGISDGIHWTNCTGKALLYVRTGSFAGGLKAGDQLQVYARWQEITGPANPGEFNYQRYLADRYISRRAYADSSVIHVLPQYTASQSLWFFALKIKTGVLSRLGTSGLSPNAVSICSALLTGFDDEIEKDVLRAFSHSGTLHILSVSGLHTGLIYAVLSFFFRLFDKKRKYKHFEFALVTLILWGFALFTGFSPPVLRAVIMFNLLGAGKLYFRNTSKNQINILCVSAFSLLLYDPLLIMDLGFVLSYGAMLGLLYYQARFESLYEIENRVLASLWSSTCASFSATFSTLPITLYFFKQFPLWFVLCNLLVVPASFLLLLLALFVVLNVPFIITPANLLTEWMVDFVNLFDSQNLGYIDNIDFRLSDAFFLSCLIIFLSIAFARHSKRLVFSSLLILLIWQSFSLMEGMKTKNKEELLLFSIRRGSAIGLRTRGGLKLAMTDSAGYDYSVKPWVTAQNYPGIRPLRCEAFRLEDDYLIQATRQDTLPQVPLSQIRFLVCGSKFKITEKLLKSLGAHCLVILDGTNDHREINRVMKLCRNFGRPLWVLSKEGALQIVVKNRHYEVENWR